jgi:hypothetical protein
MRILASAVAGLALAGVAAASANAQRLAEQFIPIGESPGVSGVTSVVGEVTDIDERQGVMTVDVGGEPVGFVMTPFTNVWLDQSDERQASLDVGYDGLLVGDRVEVKAGDPVAAAAGVDAEGAPVADWIKIDATARQ